MSDPDFIEFRFKCPISHVIMTDPVFAQDGITYDRSAIEDWVSETGISPATGEPMKNVFMTNYLVRYQLGQDGFKTRKLKRGMDFYYEQYDYEFYYQNKRKQYKTPFYIYAGENLSQLRITNKKLSMKEVLIILKQNYNALTEKEHDLYVKKTEEYNEIIKSHSKPPNAIKIIDF